MYNLVVPSGLSLRNSSDPMITKLAAAAQSILGDKLDAYLLGNVGLQQSTIPDGRYFFSVAARRSNRNQISTLAMVKDQTSPTTQLITTSVCVPIRVRPTASRVTDALCLAGLQ